MSVNRREALLGVLAGGSTGLLASPAAVSAADTSGLAISWTATGDDKSFVSFNEDAYLAMRNDRRRTSLFVKAIKQRLAKAPPRTMTVLDLGTGPEALLALAAARAGAKKVYAIEANPEVARRARDFVKKAIGIAPGTVEVIEGFSTAVDLPEKVDFLVAEISGSIASEEGAYATIRDAQGRFMKQPSDPNSYIPYAMQTLGAPASYTLHYSLGRPGKRPVRLNCRDTALELLADPLIVEDIRFSNTALPASGIIRPASPLAWRIDPSRITANEKTYFKELRKENVAESDAAPFARAVSRSFSGIALWPRLVLDAEGTMVVEARGPKGESQDSHWQTVLPLPGKRPSSIEPGDSIRVSYEVDLREGNVSLPPKYSLTADISSS